MKRLSFKIRLTIGFSIPIIISFVIVTLAILQIQKISLDTELIYEHPLVVSNSVRDINVNINAIHRSMKDVVLSENIEQLNSNIVLVNLYDSLIHHAFDIVEDKFLGNKSIINDAYIEYKAWKIIRNEVISLTKTGNYVEATKITKGKGHIQVGLVFEKTKVLTDFAQNKADELYQGILITRKNGILILLVISVILLLLSILASIIISNSISKPIRNFIKEINQIYRKKSLPETEIIKKSEQEILSHTVLELKDAYERLEGFNIELEQKVEERTTELKKQNDDYLILNKEYKLANKQLKTAKDKSEENEIKLKESNNTKDKFFAIIAHDLKSPFNSLLGFSNLLVEKYESFNETKRTHFINIINESAKNSYNLLEDLLEWSRAQSDKIEFSPQKIEIKALIDEIISLLQQSATNKEIKLSNTTKSELFVYADKNMTNTIFRNLISNAIKFTLKNGTVIISAIELKEKDLMEISVTDTGVGISKERIADLFSVDKNNSTLGTENERGTGLGLVISKEFVEKNKGKINVESKIELGSKFVFTLPTRNNNEKPK